MFKRRILPAFVLASSLCASPTQAHDQGAADAPSQSFPTPVDLRRSHWLFSVGAGVATPNTELIPSIVELGELTAGPSLRARIGWGLNRHLVMTLDGGLAHIASQTGCDGCSATTFDFGGGLAYHISQGFGFDPWISYSIAYRQSVINLSDQTSAYSGIDFSRIALGGNYYPLPSFGFGPFLELNLGMRDQSNTSVYSIFHAGIQLTFDPMRSGTRLTPSVASR